MIHLSILSPVSNIFDSEVHYCSVPAKENPFSILKDHAPIISELGPGIIHIQEDDKHSFDLVINTGFVEVKNNVVTVLLDEQPIEKENINIEETEKELEEVLQLKTSTEAEALKKENKIRYLRALVWAQKN